MKGVKKVTLGRSVPVYKVNILDYYFKDVHVSAAGQMIPPMVVFSEK